MTTPRHLESDSMLLKAMIMRLEETILHTTIQKRRERSERPFRIFRVISSLIVLDLVGLNIHKVVKIHNVLIAPQRTFTVDTFCPQLVRLAISNAVITQAFR